MRAGACAALRGRGRARTALALALLAAAALALALCCLVQRRAPPPPPPPRAPARLLPHEHWAHRRDHPAGYAQPSCSPFPAPAELQWAAASWQRLALPAGSLYLYAAHWDARATEPLVRVLVYCDVAPLPNLTCLLWYEDRNAPEAVPASATYGWREEWGGPFDTVNEPYVLACAPPPARRAAPRALSLVAGAAPCQRARNVLAVQGAGRAACARGSPRGVAACTKWLDYAEDASAELAEWVELLRALGAVKLYVYVLQCHPNMRRLLEYYSELGFADVTMLEHPPRARELGSAASRAYRAMRRELLPLNDALYRAAPRHAWLAVLDMDELIVPLRDATWPELVERETREMRREDAHGSADAFVFLNYYFLRAAQREMAAPPPAHMLAHVWRARDHSPPGHYVKSFHNLSSVVALHNHTPLSCGARACREREVPPAVGRLQHYRSRCGEDAAECAALREVVRDAALATRHRRVLRDVRRVLRRLRIPLPPAPPAPPAPSAPPAFHMAQTTALSATTTAKGGTLVPMPILESLTTSN